MSRLGYGTWVEADESWKSSIGDGPLKQISRTVGINGANRPDDVARIETLLDRTGHLDLGKTNGPTGYFGQRLDQSIRDFQKDRGLKRDGMLNPAGETIATLRRESGITTNPIKPKQPSDIRVPVDEKQPDTNGEFKVAMAPALPFLLRMIGLGAGAVGGGLFAQNKINEYRKKTPDLFKQFDIAPPLPPLPPSKRPDDKDRLPSKTEYPAKKPEFPIITVFPIPEEREAAIETFPMDDVLGKMLILENSRGTPDTQLKNDIFIKILAQGLNDRDVKEDHIGGGHSPDGKYKKERYLKPGGGYGAARPDGSFKVETKDGVEEYIDFNTVDTLKDGKTLDSRERRAFEKIQRLKEVHGESGDVFTQPKGKNMSLDEWRKEAEAAVNEYLDARYGKPKIK